jgi:predicted nuclease with TOPRIM domain
MKNKTQIQQEVKNKMDEIHAKITNIRNKMEEEKHPSEELRNTVKNLKNIHSKLNKKHNRVKDDDTTDWDEMEKNMYQDFTSFNRSFKKAGTLFRGK